MRALFREETPYSLRLFIAIPVLTSVLMGWILIVNGPRNISVSTSTIGAAVLLVGFTLLGVLRTQRLPFLPLWISLGFSTLWSGLMILSLPSPISWLSTLILCAVILLSISAAVLAVRNARITRALMIPLALLGVYGVVVVPVAVWNGGGPKIQGTGAPIAVLGAACLTAAWHAWSLRDRARTANRA